MGPVPPQVGTGVPGLLMASETCSPQCLTRTKDERNGLTGQISSPGAAAVSPVHCCSAWAGRGESLPLSVLNNPSR